MSVPTLQHYDTSEYLDVGLAAGSQGGALYTSQDGDSTYQTQVGDLVRDEQMFRFSGMHGEFLELHGVVGRPIVWEGMLRVSDAGLSDVRGQRDAFRMLDGVFTFTDDDGAEYANCTIRAFELGRKRRIQVPGNTNLVWLVPYRIMLQQMEP